MYIKEYGGLTQLVGDAGQMPDENTVMAQQQITFSASSAPSAALNPGTKFVRIKIDGTSPANVKIAFGSVTTPPAPVAVVGVDEHFSANQAEYKGVPTNGLKATDGSLIQVKIAAVNSAA
jgi:hypothetical protein